MEGQQQHDRGSQPRAEPPTDGQCSPQDTGGAPYHWAQIASQVHGLLLLAIPPLSMRIPGLVQFLQNRIGKKSDIILSRRAGSLLTSSPDPSTALFRTISFLQQELEVDRIALFVTDGIGRQAELLTEAQVTEYAGSWAGRLLLKQLPPLAEFLRGGQPVLWDDVDSHHLPPESAHLLSADLPALLLQPLIAGATPVGFLALANTHPGPLERFHKQDFLEPTAHTLALYIHVAGLQPDVLRPQDQIELLYEVTTHLNTDLSLDKVMSNILTQAISKVGATRGSIFLLDEKGTVAHRILARENLSPEISQLVIEEIMDKGLASWILEHKVGTIVRDTLADDRWLVLPDHVGNVRSAVAVPFLRQNQIQGMLFLTHPEIDRFRQEHLDLLTSIANQSAIAIQNARLYEWAENERRTMAAVLNSSADAVLVIDPEGQVLLANSAARQALGIENRPAPLSEVLYHPDLLSLFQQATSEEGTVCQNVLLEDGRTFSVSIAPVGDREDRTIGRVAVMHDITHMIELDEMKSRFVSTVSHDLKAPLTAIRGFIDLMGVVGPLNEDQTQFIERMRSVVDSMTHLIADLLDLGRIEAGLGMSLESVDLRDILISGKYDLAMPAQEKNILIEIEVPPGLCPVQADPFRLQQVVTNLLSNAIKYTPRGGRVWVRAEEQSNHVLVSVQDTGIGIPPADLPHVFDKFYRVEDPQVRDQDGTGLGLAIVKSIVEEHGGRVWAESTLGKGSTFYFTLLRE